MAPYGPPFDFDLNELPPRENDGVDGISEAPVPEPSAHHQDPLLTEPVPEPSAKQDPPPPPAQAPEPTAAHVPLPARSPAPAPEAASPDEPLPAPLRAPVPPVPSPPHHQLPSPVLDLEGPLSSLDDDEDEDEDEADQDLPPPPPPPLPLPPPPPTLPSWYRADDTSDDALTVSSGRPGDAAARQLSSPETWAAPRGSRAAATASDTTSSHRTRRRPYSCDDAISRQRRRVDDDYDEVDGGSSRSRKGSRRGSEFGSSPRRYERSGPAPPRHRYYEQEDGGRHAPAADALPRVPAKNRRPRRRAQQRPQHGYGQYEGPVQKQLGRGRQQQQPGFRGQERPQVHHGPHHGPEVPKVGYTRLSPEQERGGSSWDRRDCREKDAPPFRPSSSRPHGREDLYRGRQSHQAQEPPKIGGYQHRDREAPSFRPSSTGAHGGRDDDSYGRRHIPPEEKAISGGARHQQQRMPPHHRGRDEQLPDRAYHPYARRGSGFDRPRDFDRPDDCGGRNPARREPRGSYEHQRYSKQLRSEGPPARALRYYGDVQE